MFFVPNVPFGRLPVITNLVENSKEVRGSEILISGIAALLFSIGIVVHVSLAVGYVMSMLPARVMRPMMFASIGCMCVELVELIAVWGTMLGRGNEELSKSSLLLRLLLAGRERRGWQRERRMIGSRRDLTRTWGGKCGHPGWRVSAGCRWDIQFEEGWFGSNILYNHYLRDGWLLWNRFRPLGSHEVNATVEGHGQVLSFTSAVDGGRAEPRPSIDGHLPKFF